MKRKAVLQTETLMISAGHSNSDPGARGNGYAEADIVLEFRDLVADELRKRQVVFMKDGERGQNLPLSVAAGLAAKTDVAVEFHCNAFSSPAATGVETLSSPEHFKFGERLCQAVAKTLEINNRGAKPEASGQHSRLAFVSKGNGVILELFFITNPRDVAAYQARKERLAAAVAAVLIEEICQ